MRRSPGERTGSRCGSRWRRLGGRTARLLLALSLLSLGAGGIARADEVELIPDEAAGFGARNLLGLFRRGYYYGEHRIEVETTPPDAVLDLSYVRAGFQKLYEQAEAPATLILPRRADAGPRDFVTIRAFAEGFRHKSVTIPVLSDEDHVLIELEPLPNALEALAHVYFAGRDSLSFLVKQAPTVRVQPRDDGFNVILAETAQKPELGEGLSQVHSPLVREIAAQQLGEDLLVEVRYAEGVAPDSLDLRSRQSQDPIRGLHRFTLDMVPKDGGAESVRRARAALAELSAKDIAGCNAEFDAGLRAALDPAALNRALAPRGEFTDPYLRAALRRLGEVSPQGAIEMVDGKRYRPGIPLELGAAATQAAHAKGYLALLRSFVARLEAPPYRQETLRSLVAPELDPRRFAEALAAAQQRERSCRGGSS